MNAHAGRITIAGVKATSRGHLERCQGACYLFSREWDVHQFDTLESQNRAVLGEQVTPKDTQALPIYLFFCVMTEILASIWIKVLSHRIGCYLLMSSLLFSFAGTLYWLYRHIVPAFSVSSCVLNVPGDITFILDSQVPRRHHIYFG
jgi:hypothetical protein